MYSLSGFARGFRGSTQQMCHSTKTQLVPSTIITSKTHAIGHITLNRPEKRNALNKMLRMEVMQALQEFDRDKEVRCIIISGAGNSFAAGADIKEMLSLTHADVVARRMFSEWDGFQHIEKVIIAAVRGYAFGGGCELAMLCDVVIAAHSAVFALPEITIGTHPGIGGTQRLVHAVGKSKAMEWILTGQQINAQKALETGLVSRVVADEDLLTAAEETAQKITSMSLPITKLIKKCINYASEPSPGHLSSERTSFYSTFALRDRFEGMDAFVNKRPPQWTGE